LIIADAAVIFFISAAAATLICHAMLPHVIPLFADDIIDIALLFSLLHYIDYLFLLMPLLLSFHAII